MDSEHWHLDKRLNIGHILTTASALAALFVWGSTIETRISVLEEQYEHTQLIQIEIKNQLVRLNDKMDRLIEKQNGLVR